MNFTRTEIKSISDAELLKVNNNFIKCQQCVADNGDIFITKCELGKYKFLYSMSGETRRVLGRKKVQTTSRSGNQSLMKRKIMHSNTWYTSPERHFPYSTDAEKNS